jgi:hypothetical protein
MVRQAPLPLIPVASTEMRDYSMSPESDHRLRDKDMRKNKELKRGERI